MSETQVIRTCTDCGQAKPLVEFHKAKFGKHGVAAYCKPCRAKQKKAEYQNHKDTYKENSKIWRASEKGIESYNNYAKPTARKYSLLRNYGVTIEMYEAMMHAQGGVCLICGGVNKNGRRLSVDHDHVTGAVRGLLCSACNFLIGHAKESIDVLNKAIGYLNSWNNRNKG